MTGTPAIQYVTTPDGINIAHYVIGSGMPVVVLLPNPSSHLTLEWEVPAFRAFYERLAQSAMLIRLDYRGSGLSERAITGLTASDMHTDISAVLDRLGIRRAGFYGWGFGGTIALSYASHLPGRVSRIVLAESNATEGGASLNRRLAELREVNTAVQIQTRATLIAGWSDHANAQPMAALIAGALDANAVPIMWRGLIGNSNVFETAANVTAPILLIHAAEDPLFTLAGAQRLAALLPRSRLQILPGSAALTPFTNPAGVDAAVDFLLEPDTPGEAGASHRPLPSLPADLSGRELAVLRLIAAGKTNQQIAADLYISASTVSHHVTSILLRTGASNRTEAAALAHHYGLIPQ